MTPAELVQLVDRLEESAASYLTLPEVAAAAPAAAIDAALEDDLLLIDHRTRRDGTRVTLCRLNRHHPLVVELTRW